MKKKILMLIAAAILILSLQGCFIGWHDPGGGGHGGGGHHGNGGGNGHHR